MRFGLEPSVVERWGLLLLVGCGLGGGFAHCRRLRRRRLSTPLTAQHSQTLRLEGGGLGVGADLRGLGLRLCFSLSLGLLSQDLANNEHPHLGGR